MATVTVHHFEVWDINRSDWVRLPLKSTAERIMEEIEGRDKPPMACGSAHTAQFEAIRPSALASISGGSGWKAVFAPDFCATTHLAGHGGALVG
jgi:hypothetical protein